METLAEKTTTRAPAPGALVDCDIHNHLTPEAVARHLPSKWREYGRRFGRRMTPGDFYPKATPMAARTDAWPPGGGPPGSDLAFLRKQLLDAWPIGIGVLNTLLSIRNQYRDYDAALATAANACQIADWLEPEPRLRASLIVPYEDAALAVAEIRRHAGDRRFVQVLIPSRTSEPLGQRKYWPIYEAACEAGLPIGIHFGGWSGGHPISAAGWPAFYLEYHTGMVQTFQAHAISLICEGAFEALPGLKVVFIEGGLAWIAPLLWRLDRCWTQLRSENPRLTRAPSEVFRSHFWLTTQPIEEPPDPAQFVQMLAHLGMDDRLLFSTDYPHWDFDSPDASLPSGLPADLRRRIQGDNARALYGLPR
jgi:predicted TIM-barrel fold metal-dependent hydrolase